MYPSVQSQFRKFNEQFEGVVPHMYVDVKQLVTIGVGNLIDSVEEASALPFRFKNKPGISTPGALASKEQIASEWRKIKDDKSLAKRGCDACAPITDLELYDEDLDRLIAKRLFDNESFLKRQAPFKKWDTWPADAQLAVLSMAWAMGSGGVLNFPKFCASCKALDFKSAAAECKMSEEGNPGVKPRNRANFTLLSNAAVIQASAPSDKLDRSALYYPKVLAKTKTAAAGVRKPS